MKSLRKGKLEIVAALLAASLLTACGSRQAQSPAAAPVAAPPAAKLGIRPYGDEEIQIDLSQIKSDELKKVFSYIDEHIDEHVAGFQKWIQQPSISNTGEGMQESAEMVKGFFDQLGCQESQIYDMGMTEWGQQGNPVVYAKCDEGAEKTVVVYWMYDTMPVTQPDLWKAPPFKGELVEQAPFKKVLIGRGALNTKGPQIAELNALMSIKAVTGKLPVNIIFVAEGDEERMSMGYRKFMTEHPEKFAGADAMYLFGFQSGGGGGLLGAGSEGLFYVELTTSGAKWGQGPNYSDIHGGNKRTVASPAWRHIKMLSTLIDEDTNKVLIDGFYENIEPISRTAEATMRAEAGKVDLKKAAEALGVEKFNTEDPYEFMKRARYGQSLNLDGIWGGNMFAGGSGSILPNKIVSKHSFRYVPNMTSADLLQKLRRHLDKRGYTDVEINVIGDQPWSKVPTNSEIGRAVAKMMDAFNMPHAALSDEPTITLLGGAGEATMAGAWPAYLVRNDRLMLPVISGSAGAGGNAHASNEYYVIEGAGKVYGLAGAEKSIATVMYNFAGKN